MELSKHIHGLAARSDDPNLLHDIAEDVEELEAELARVREECYRLRRRERAMSGAVDDLFR